MGDGILSDERLRSIEEAIASIPGDLAEVGVGSGGLFRRLIDMAKRRGCIAHAFDSFKGMDEPGEYDSPEYWRGRFDAGGVEAFAESAGLETTGGPFALHAGFVPDCFAGFSSPLALAYIDLDHYGPTRVAIETIAPLVVPGGVLAFDDYFPKETSVGASKAIAEALVGLYADFEHFGYFLNNQLILRRKTR